ncbi:unnamed protein product [Symbiodinium microadriaticum]|nr:unnamed protein product [Symbiodinium microadriaticum]
MIRTTAKNLFKFASPMVGRATTSTAYRSAPRLFVQASRFMSTSESAKALAEALTSEILHESAEVEQDEDYEDVKKLMTKSFKVTDNAGFGGIKLERTYKDEHITITFDCQDEVDEAHDDFGYDKMEDALKAQAEKEANGEEGDDFDGVANQFGINFEVVVKKDGKAVVFSCVASQHVVIENVSYRPDASSEDTKLYGGPRYIDLDESVREAFQNYLAERKIDEDFSYYVVNAARAKEEKEYVYWMEKITEFVE